MIGCAGNFEFGVSRIIKSLEPMARKLETDTWFYAKRCLLALAEILAKHMLVIKVCTFTGTQGLFTWKYGDIMAEISIIVGPLRGICFGKLHFWEWRQLLKAQIFEVTQLTPTPSCRGIDWQSSYLSRRHTCLG